MREKDFEREHAEPKKKNKREERERERNRSKEQKQKRERAFFSFFSSLLSLSLCVRSLSLLSCFFRFFFSRDESLLRSSNIQTRHSFRTTTLVFSTSHLSLSESLSLGLSRSLGVVAQKNKF